MPLTVMLKRLAFKKDSGPIGSYLWKEVILSFIEAQNLCVLFRDGRHLSQLYSVLEDWSDCVIKRATTTVYKEERSILVLIMHFLSEKKN